MISFKILRKILTTDLKSTTYRKIPIISRGLIQLRKGFLVSKQKLFWQGSVIVAM